MAYFDVDLKTQQNLHNIAPPPQKIALIQHYVMFHYATTNSRLFYIQFHANRVIKTPVTRVVWLL